MPPAPRDPDYRPLLAATPRRVADGIELDVGSQTVFVGGPADELLAIAALCDGKRATHVIVDALPQLEAADLVELLEQLDDAGAVVDTSEAWRVFHRWTGIDSGLGRPVTPAQVQEILAERYEQPGIEGEPVDLDGPPTAIDRVLERRRSSELADPPRYPSFGELSALLAAMYAGDGHGGRPVPSGGGLYPLAVHVVLRAPLGPLDPGAWWFDSAARQLRRVATSRGSVEQAMSEDSNTAERTSGVQPLLFVSADVARGSRKYASRAYRLALIEVGAVTQNAYLVAADLKVPIRALLGVDDRAAVELLALPDGTVPLLAILLGR